MSNDTTPPADPVPAGEPQLQRVELVLTAHLYRRVELLADRLAQGASHNVSVEALIPGLLGEIVDYGTPSELAEQRATLRVEVARLQAELDNSRAQAQDAAQQLNKMTQGERGA